MEARGKEILGVITKETTDLRGRQLGIIRQLVFDREAFLHMVFYRALIIFAPIVGIVIIADLLAPGAVIDADLEIMIAIVWFLFTVQVYEETKAAIVIATKGAVYGRLNESFSSYGTSKHWLNSLLWFFPPVATGAWITSFFVLLYMWFI